MDAERTDPRAAAVVLPCLLQAQGITTAAVQGAVTRADGTPIAEAHVEFTNSSTGQRWQLQTGPGGRYFLESATIGGPYRIAVRAVGFRPASREGMYLSLGQRYTLDFQFGYLCIRAGGDRGGPGDRSTNEPRTNRPGTGRPGIDHRQVAEPIPQRDYPAADQSAGELRADGRHLHRWAE